MDIALGVVGTLAGVVLGHWLARRGQRKDAEQERLRRDAAQVLDLVIEYESGRNLRRLVTPPPKPGSMAASIHRVLEPLSSPRKRIDGILARGRLPNETRGLVVAYLEAADNEDSQARSATALPGADNLELLQAGMDEWKATREAFGELRDYLRDLAR